MKVSWDYEIPNIWENNPNVPHHQPVVYLHLQMPSGYLTVRHGQIHHFQER